MKVYEKLFLMKRLFKCVWIGSKELMENTQAKIQCKDDSGWSKVLDFYKYTYL